LFAIATVCSGQAPLPEPVTDQETELGLAVYNELKAKGEIVDTSPLYDTLRPIADAITRVAQSRYNHPFKFFVVHEPNPNAFATPGGNVYVVDSLFYFVKNTEQFAGTLCHEVSQTIHRDAMERLKEGQKIQLREIGAALLLGPSIAEMLAIKMIGDLHSLAYSRDVESRADLTGADICAATGYNPWGGCLTNFRTPIPRKSLSFCRTIPQTTPGQKRSGNTSARTRRFSPNSTRARRMRRRSQCPKTKPSISCARDHRQEILVRESLSDFGADRPLRCFSVLLPSS
jgi:Peptidase family M48